MGFRTCTVMLIDVRVRIVWCYEVNFELWGQFNNVVIVSHNFQCQEHGQFKHVCFVRMLVCVSIAKF